MSGSRQVADGDEVPAQLRNEVSLLGRVLGEVLVESGGHDLLDAVERLRLATIDLRRSRGDVAQRRLEAAVALVDGFDEARCEAVARAFTVYFQLVNLAEERHRVRTLRERSQSQPLVPESLARTVADLRAREGEDSMRQLIEGLQIRPVLTAHPTEARRRAVVDALRRVAELMERQDDPRLSAAERADVERGLREQVTILWLTSQLRHDSPTPLDEVRAAMAVFDETLFRLVPLLYREMDRALAGPDASGSVRPTVPAFLRWGSWVGGDRDGNPHVDHETTRDALGIQADHLLRGLENATRRIGRSLTVSESWVRPSSELLASIRADEARGVNRAEEIRKRSPGEPHRQKLLLAAEKLVATRVGNGTRYLNAEQFRRDLLTVQESLAAAGAVRLAYGELQDLMWQAESFGFHLASLEVRQHSDVHRAAVEELARGASADARELDRLASDGWPPGAIATSAPAREVLDTFRTMAEIQAGWGTEACRRYVVSFTRAPADVIAVMALARLAVKAGELEVDPVPLFESRADLEAAIGVLDGLLELPGWRHWLESRDRRLEVMLGYSDATKDAGFLAANVALYGTQEALAAWARRNDVRLTIFHGRGGAVGRGGGPAGRAIRGQAPGSVSCRFKVTEQGEVISARYDNLGIGLRHLEQVTSAVLTASTAGHEAAMAAAASRFRAESILMARVSEEAYRDLVGRPGFAEFFARVSPLDEISRLRLGSRPARRAGSSAVDLEGLRAIPWVFAWAQNRCNLPGWYGLGSGLAAVAREYGVDRLRRMNEEWPFFNSLLDNAEMSLAKADPLIADLYLRLGDRSDVVEMIRAEFFESRRQVIAATGHPRMLAGRPVLRRAVDLRNPYVDALSLLQLRFLSELRRGDLDELTSNRLADLALLTVNGVAAGLQNTG